MPEAVGAIVLGAIGLDELAATVLISIGATSITVGAVAGSAILIGGSIGLQMLLAPQRPNMPTPGSPALPPPDAMHVPIRQAIPPRIVGYGRNRLGGAYVLYEAKSGISYDVIALHHGPIGGFVGFYLDDDVVTINGSGVVDVLGDGRYGSSAVTLKTRSGAVPETVYSEIATPLSAIWTSAHRGDGVASLAMICNQLATPSAFANTFPRGHPNPSVVADCAPIFDPRISGQSHADSTTWTVSTNPVLQLIDFLTNPDRGMGLDYDTLIGPVLTQLSAQADICDALVLRNDGTSEARYKSSGVFTLDADPADVIQSILDSCDGWISQNGDGSLSLFVGHYLVPSVELTSEHIRGCVLQYDLADEEVVNELTIDYTEPLLDYKTEPGQPWRNETDISERGRTRSQRLALPWVQSHAQARRLAKRRDAQNNAALRGTLTTTLYGLRCLGERWVQLTAPDLPDLENVVIEVRGMTVDLLNATCSIKFISIDIDAIDAWDQTTEEGTAATVPTKQIYSAPAVPTNPAAVKKATHITVPPRIIVYFDDPGRSDLRYQVEYRVNGSGDPFTQESLTSSSICASGSIENLSGVPVGKPFVYAFYSGGTFGVTYEIKVRAFPPSGTGSAFSNSCTVTY